MEHHALEHLHVVDLIDFDFEGQLHQLVVEGPQEGGFAPHQFDDPAWREEVVLEELGVFVGVGVEESAHLGCFELGEGKEFAVGEQTLVDLLVAVFLYRHHLTILSNFQNQTPCEHPPHP